MKGILLTLFLAGILSFSLAGSGVAQYVHIGKGCTTAYYIDEDCDGYGVGTGYVFGVDADDMDPSINTLASVESVYGELDSGDPTTAKANLLNFLSNRQAASYTGIGDVFYVSTSGNDATGQPNDYSKPFATFNTGVKNHPSFGAGDLVVYREGLYTQYLDLDWVNGASNSPVIFMSFPGEKATLIYQYVYPASIVLFAHSSHIIIDTLQLGPDNVDTVFYSQGIAKASSYETHHVEIRFCECLNNYQGTRLQYNFHDVVFEHNVVHHNTGGGNHLNYWGGSGCYNQLFKDNIFYANIVADDFQLFHWNYLNSGNPCSGAIDNLVWEGNIFHSGRKNGLDLMNGPFTNIRIENNLFFNNGGVDLMFWTYSSTCPGEVQASVVNNHFWKGSDPGPYGGVDPEPYYFLMISNDVDNDPHSITIRNNVFHTYNSYMILSDQDNQISNSIIENNIFYRENGNTIARVNGINYNFAEFENSWGSVISNLYSNPLFEDVSINYNLNPENFNFDLTSTSPAIDFGAPVGAPLYDLRGDPRTGNPDAGCYEYASGETPEWSLIQLQNGTGSDKLELIFIPSGFAESEASTFEAEVQNNLVQLWQNNFFSDFRQRFDVYQVTDRYDSDGNLKTDSEIINLINTYDTCSFGSSGTCRKIHIVIEDQGGYLDETTKNFVRLRLEADSDYTLAHEISVHVLGDLRPYNGPLMKDEYINLGSCSLNNYTYIFINAHDRNSNEKWSDLESGPPYPGSAYCPHFYRPTENSIARGSNNRDCDNVGYRAAEIGLSKRTQDGGIYDEKIKPSVSVDGITSGMAYSEPINITVQATDASGIDRVEFYLSVDGEEFRSIGVDRTDPYTHSLDLNDYTGTEYYVRIYVFDEAWNMFGGNLDGLQYGPVYNGSAGPDLILHLDFEEGSGNTASDSSGNGNDANINGAVYTPDSMRGDYALEFDGADNYISITDSQSMDFDKSRGSIEMWIKPVNPSSGVYQLLAIDSNYGIEFNIHPTGDLFYYPWADTGTWNNYNLVTNPLTAGEWQHLVVTWEFSTGGVKFYINGTEQTPAKENVPAYWTSIASTGDWYIGGGSAVKDEYFSGIMDDVRVYSRALGPEEVMEHFKEGECHRADRDCDGCIIMEELIAFIDRWKISSQDMPMWEMMEAISLWKSGAGCVQ